MIKYEGVENKYLYDKQILENIIRMLESGTYAWDDNDCTQENVSVLINEVNAFISSISPVGQKVMLERHETEEEARAYFGTDFIEKFDRLMTILDGQQTVVALHGTEIENCPLICENGLQYKTTSLYATSLRPNMAFGQSDIRYNNYEKLLNWPYEKKKGIVILAVPYECHYKEGIWNHFQNTNTGGMGGQDYRIDPDFVVGYIDVVNKSIVLNPKYNRQHNYDGYINDTDMFHENKNIDNMAFARMMIAEKQKALQEGKDNVTPDNKVQEERKVEPTEITNLIELMRGMFAAVLNGSPDGMNQKAYEDFLGELANSFRLVQQVFPLLKTNEQVRLEKEEEEKRWAEYCQTLNSHVSDSDWEQWNNMDWEETPEEEQKTGRSL